MRWALPGFGGSEKKNPVARRSGLRPWLETLEDRTLLSTWTDFTSALGTRLDALSTSFRDTVSAASAALPILNQPLSSVTKLMSTVHDFRTTIVNQLNTLDPDLTNEAAEAQIQNALYGALTGAGILGDRNGGGLAPDDVWVDVNAGNLTIEVRLTGSAESSSAGIGFGLGLAGLPLEIDGMGQLAITAAYDYKNLSFGLNNNTFFLDTSGADEITASVTASVKNPTMRGVIGFLEMDATATKVGNPETTLPTALGVNLTFDVQSPAPGDPPAPDSIAIVDPRLGGSADINLTLTGSFNGAIKYQVPSIATDFHMHWDLGGPYPTDGQTLGSEPIVDFNNVRVSLGQFLSNMVAPIVADVQTFTRPLSPLLELLNHRLTGVSELSEKAGLGPVSFLTLAKVASSTGTLPPDTKAAVDLIVTLAELADLINNIQTNGGVDVYLPIGGFNLNQLSMDLRGLPGLVQNPAETLRQIIGKLDPKSPLTDPTKLVSIGQEQFTKLEQLVNQSGLPQAVKNRMAQLTDEIKYKLDRINNGVKLEFPFIENPKAGVFNLLLGRDAEFVTFTTKFVFENSFDDPYNLFKVGTPLGPVQVQAFVTGNVNVDLLLKVGYDSYGLRRFFKAGDPLELLNGFYIDSKRPELLKFNGEARVGLRGTLPLFGFANPFDDEDFIGVTISAEFTGGARITGSKADMPFFVRLIDPNKDRSDADRLRVGEALTQPQLFETDGKVVGDLKAEFIVRTPFPIVPDVVLYSLDVASETLIDLSQPGHPQYTDNPFYQKPSDPIRLTPVITDLNFLPTDGSGHDGVPNYLRLTRETAADGKQYYRLYFKNGLIEQEGPGNRGKEFILVERPLSGNDAVGDITLLGASDDDHITMENSLLRDVTINGRGGDNSLTINSGSGRYAYTFKKGEISEKNTSDFIKYEGIDEVAVNAQKSSGAAFYVKELSVGSTLIIDGSRVVNSFTIGDPTMSKIQGNLVLRGGAGDDTISFFDQASADSTTWIVNYTGLKRISEVVWGVIPDATGALHPLIAVDVLSFDLTDIERVTVHGGGKVNSLFGLVNGNRGQRYELHPNTVSDLRIVGGTADDTYVLGSDASGLNTQGNDFNLTISDKGGNDELHVNDRGTRGQLYQPGSIRTDYVYTVNNQAVKRDVIDLNAGQDGLPRTDVYRFEVKYAGLENVSLYGGTVDASYLLQGFLGKSLGVVTGAANDRVTLGTSVDGFRKFTRPPSIGKRLPVSVFLQDLGGVDDLQVNHDVVYLDHGTITDFTHVSASNSGFETLGVNTPNRANTYVEVRGLAQDVAATIFGAARVKVGTGTLANIKGPVFIATDASLTPTGNSLTALSIDDSADPAPTTFMIGSKTISAAHGGAAPFFAVDFGSADLSSLSLSAGSGGNLVTLADTRDSKFTGPITLNTGLGTDTVNIEKTRTSVTVNGQNSADTVNVGKDGSVQGIAAQVTITNVGAWSAVNLDDSRDPIARAVTLNNVGTFTRVTGLALAMIAVRQTDLSALSIAGGGGNNTFTIQNTPLSTFPSGAAVNVQAGAGDDTVNVQGSTGNIAIHTQAGSNTVNIGRANKLDGISGAVNVDGLGGAAVLNVNDLANATPRQFTLRRDTLNANIGYASLAQLNVNAGRANDTFQVYGTPAGAITTLRGGPGIDFASFFGTDGELLVDLGAGVGQKVEIGNLFYSLEGLNGRVTVTAARPIVASVTNQADPEQAQLVIDHAGAGVVTLKRSEFRDAQYVLENQITFTSISSLDVQTGPQAFGTFVSGTPAGMTLSVHGATGHGDVLFLNLSDNKILGPVNYYGEDVQDFAYYYDYLNTAPHTYTMRTDPMTPTAQRIERDGQAPFTYYGGYQIVFYASLVGDNHVNVQSVPAGVFLNMVYFDGDQVTVGSRAPNLGGTLTDIRGPLAFSGIGAVDVVLDDSGNLDTTPKQISLTPRSGVYSYGNLIQGLTGSSIQWRLDDKSTISILGGAANETYAIASSSLPAAISIDGGGGVNALDYSTYAGLHCQVNWFTGEGDVTNGWVTDDVNGQTGTLRNGATLAAGKVGNAFSLDGINDFVEIPDYPSQTPSSITLDAWVNPDTVSGQRVIVSKFDSSAPGPDNTSWVLMNIDGRIRFGVYQGASGRVIDTDAAVLTAGAWQHVAGTFDVATQAIAIYVDGVAVPTSFVPGQDAMITAISDSRSPVRIGTYVGTSGAMQGFWDGLIDEVDIFGRALSAGEIQRIFAAGSSGKSAVAGDIYVNLRTGTATGLRGGIANIRNVTGGAGNDILVGNGGNVLQGGVGRDLLIAGAFASSLFGGEGEDLLLGGTTLYDTNQTALDAIVAEWSRADLDYSTRTTNLRNGLLGNGRVTANGYQNSLLGQSGLDLFFGSVDGDTYSTEDGETFVNV